MCACECASVCVHVSVHVLAIGYSMAASATRNMQAYVMSWHEGRSKMTIVTHACICPFKNHFPFTGMHTPIYMYMNKTIHICTYMYSSRCSRELIM